MRYLVIALLGLSLSSCAPTPMSKDGGRSRANGQELEIGLQERCCAEIEEMIPTPLGNGVNEHLLGLESLIISVAGRPTTAALYTLPVNSVGKEIEFVSYSDKKRSAFRFDSVLFIAPTFVFLDADRKVVQGRVDPQVCWGAKNRKGGLWTRTTLPAGAAYVLVAARTDQNLFAIDTRQPGPSAPLMEAIAEDRQSYVTQVGTGYTGIYSMELVDQSRPRLGRCVNPTP